MRVTRLSDLRPSRPQVIDDERDWLVLGRRPDGDQVVLSGHPTCQKAQQQAERYRQNGLEGYTELSVELVHAVDAARCRAAGGQPRQQRASEESLAARVRTWLAQHPGWHKFRTIQVEMPADPIGLATALRRMCAASQIRHRSHKTRQGRITKEYAA